MVVDAVTEVVRVGADRMEPPPALIGKQQASGLGGIVRVDKGLLLVLDLQKTLAVEAVRSALVSTAEPSAAPEVSPIAPTEPTTTTLADLNIDLLERTFELVKPHAAELVDYFYTRLFEAHPGVIPLFANANMQEQRGKLLSAIVLVVTSLRKPDQLVPALQQLGIKHIGYGAEPAHYDAVGAILLESLAHVAGDAWTEEVASAWTAAYTVAANVMRDAAAEHAEELAA
jgi:hemoglobin-like flavoprotein